MDKTEIDDFKKILQQNGLPEDDFLLNNVDKTIWDFNSINGIQGQVTIKRKSTSKEKTYKTGWGTHCVIDFENDLKSGFYN